jgi:uncharacterized membrane protein
MLNPAAACGGQEIIDIHRHITDPGHLALLRVNYLLLLVGATFNAAPILALFIARSQLAQAAHPLAAAHWRWQRDSAALFLVMRAFSITLLWLSPAGNNAQGILLGLLGESLWLVYRSMKGGLRLRQRQAPVRGDAVGRRR